MKKLTHFIAFTIHILLIIGCLVSGNKGIGVVLIFLLPITLLNIIKAIAEKPKKVNKYKI